LPSSSSPSRAEKAQSLWIWRQGTIKLEKKKKNWGNNGPAVLTSCKRVPGEWSSNWEVEDRDHVGTRHPKKSASTRQTLRERKRKSGGRKGGRSVPLKWVSAVQKGNVLKNHDKSGRGSQGSAEELRRNEETLVTAEAENAGKSSGRAAKVQIWG